MSESLDKLFNDLDLDELRFVRPSKFIFFCGGVLSKTKNKSLSMRHYLLEERGIAKRLNANVILAEEANELYRDSSYKDLISFEEDIAKISSTVLIIAESAGSLAELGAFASNQNIQPYLTIVMQQKYANAESFIRFGPVQRLKNIDDDSVAFFPWRVNKKNKIIKVSAAPHTSEIVGLINERIDKSPNKIGRGKNETMADCLLIYWILYLSNAIPINKISQYLSGKIEDPSIRNIKRKLYCMRLAGWVESTHYSNVEYYYCLFDIDPLDYSFKTGSVERDSLRRKADVVTEIQGELNLPKHVRTEALARRQMVSR